MENKDFLERYEKPLFYGSLLLLLIGFSLLNVLSEGSYGGGDDYVHYRFAHFAFKYPGLLLDHWAKPLFTLLASPFAQMGYIGVKSFNLLLGILTAFFLYRTAVHCKIRQSWLLPVLLFFIPVYTTMLLSGMTEILFSFVLVFSIYWFFKERFIWAAIIISFLPLARTEGIVIWPVFLVAFLVKGQWKAIPFILAGSIIYSVIGGLYFGDFLWLYTHMPYTGTYDIYGHGELLHFVKASKIIFGIPETLLFIIGLAGSLILLLRKKGRPLLLELLLIAGSLFAFYAAHSYVWWKGINSLGLIRVMACISPLVAVYSLKGLNFLLEGITLLGKASLSFPLFRGSKHMVNLLNSRWMVPGFKFLLIGVILYLVISTPFKVCLLPAPLSPTEQLVKKAALWFENSPYKSRKVYVWDSYFYFVLGLDPYDTTQMADGIPDRHHPGNRVKPGEIVIWDAHYSAVDGRFPFDSIAANPFYRLVKIFIPRHEIQVWGQPYKLCFFERLDSARTFDNYSLLDSMLKSSQPVLMKEILLNDSFENRGAGSKNDLQDSSTVFSGKYSLHLPSGREFYTFFEQNTGKLHIEKENSRIQVRFQVHKGPAILVVSLKHRNTIYFYQPTDIKSANDSTWINREVMVPLPGPRGEKDKLSIYLWNAYKKEIYIDNVSVELIKECWKE